MLGVFIPVATFLAALAVVRMLLILFLSSTGCKLMKRGKHP